MYIIQILLPLPCSGNMASTEGMLAALHRTLVERFGGLTAYSRAPAKGKWLAHGKEERDDIVILEVMADEIDREWWKHLRKKLEAELHQQEIVIRSQVIERL
jgi:hypothetical protein